MEKVRWGIIGVGDVTERKSGPAFQKVPNSELIAVMRRDARKAEDYAKRHSVPKWYSNADKLINDPEVDVVYIATPPSSHMEYTIKVAAAGKPVYVEKPMALNYEQCRRMIKACNKANVPLYVAYYRRGLPAFQKVKELVEDGAIGEVRFVNVVHYQMVSIRQGEKLPWRVLPEISGGGLFMDMGAHTIDILDFILGPFEKVQGEASNQAGLYPADDIVSAEWVFQSGAHGTGVWCFTTFKNYEMNEIIGSKGLIRFSTFGNVPVVLETEKGQEKFTFENPENIQQGLIQLVVDDLLGKGRCPSTGQNGARTSWVMDQILKSWREKNNIHF